MKEEPKKFYRAKFFKFSENRRPPYYGTWRKKSETVHARKPLALDSVMTIQFVLLLFNLISFSFYLFNLYNVQQLDYEVDSDDEWEEEEPGESLHGSDDEKEVESEDDYEIDNGKRFRNRQSQMFQICFFFVQSSLYHMVT